MENEENSRVDPVKLLSYIERIERLEEEKKALTNDIKEVFEEAKAACFDIAAIREIIRIRKMDDGERQEKEFVLDVYRKAVGID